MESERVEEGGDASMIDANDATMFPAIADQRPRRKFLGVQVPTSAVGPGFHKGKRQNKARVNKGVRAVEVLGEETNEDDKYVYAFFDDNVVRRLPAAEFVPFHRGVMDNYIERKVNGTLLPFDYSGGPPYVHPDSRMRSSLKITLTRQQLDTLSTSDAASGSSNSDNSAEDESAEESESTSEGYEEDEAAEGTRRSTRTRGPKQRKPSSLHPSPRKTRSRGTTLVKKQPRPPPATSGSDEIDNSHSEDSDSDIQIVDPPTTSSARPKRAPPRPQHGQHVIKKPQRALNSPGSIKPKVPRVPRPMLQSYGVVVPIEENDDEGDPLQDHCPTCGVCRNSPAHELVKQKKNKEFAGLGGWIHCMRCTEAYHWTCLSAVEKSEILTASRLREEQARETDGVLFNGGEESPSKRQAINFDEKTDFICGSCNTGGVCFECYRDLNTQPQDLPSTELLFRCISCQRAAHYAHLRSPWVEESPDEPGFIEQMAKYYQDEYQWRCDDCSTYDGTVDKIIAWRPYPPNAPLLTPAEVEAKRFKDYWPREYLVKWEGKSYRRTSWVPHLWLVTAAYQKLRHFILNGTRVRLEHLRAGGIEGHDDDARRRVYEDEGGPPLPNLRAEECIPEPWKRIEQVLDVSFWAPHKRVKMLKTKAFKKRGRVMDSSTSDDEDKITIDEEETKKLEALRERARTLGQACLSPDTYETALARKRRRGGEALTIEDIDDVVWCYVKWGELEYQEASWDTPPRRGDPEWDDFEAAFKRYVQSQAVLVAKMSPAELKKRDSRIESRFARNGMEITQSYVTHLGWKLRPFQVEGVNWLSFQWWRGRPAILADEMGLGKTVQVAQFIAKLVEKKIWPHLILVPNSTILNWVREFQTWAPDVRAVPYYGDAASREIIRNYEIFHSGPTSGQTKLKLHVLITTYETFLSKNEWAAVFKAPTRWETLVIDEGQRLKNNASLLFQRLNTISVGHRILMTGTPLNNNLRELFNLMNFIDPENWSDVEELERQYQQDLLTPAHVAELHEKLKGYFLRRTKEILNLPHKHEIIVPVSLSKLQKGIYKSLIESNLSLLNTLVSSGPKTKTSKTNLRNILMQSRKCVQHPYLVDNDLEPAAKSDEEMHRQLIDASGKLKFLKIMLANLKARGRRVLLFSQFVIALDIIEDFVVGEGYKFLRLDGDLKGSLRQKDIDRFNAPDSDYFIYLLSTRAGGVGINLATADTVIIFDPDFNPHQDAQAIARAHRFGQKNPVIVFRMMSVTGPEKKIMHAGKKKLLLDHVIVQNMEDEEPAEDLEAMLLSGAKSLFEGGDDNDIIYTEASIDSMIENAIQEASKPREAIAEASGLTFEFAQIWESSGPTDNGNEPEVDTDFWAKMMEQAQEEKERLAAQEVAESGRGAKRRAKAAVTYQVAFEESPQKKPVRSKKSDQEDVDYHEQDFGVHNGANTDATSDEGEPHVALLSIVQGEVKELQDSTPKAQEEKERKLKIRREQRQRLKLRKEEEQRLAAHHAAQAAVANQEVINQLTTAYSNGLPEARGLVVTSTMQPMVHSSGSLSASQIGPTQPPLGRPMPISSASTTQPPSNSTRTPKLAAPVVQQTREPLCKLCGTRHGLGACPAVQTLEDLKALRVRLLRSNEPPEEKKFAIQCLDEDIAKREREALDRTTSYPAAVASSSQSYSMPTPSGSANTGTPYVGNGIPMKATTNKRPSEGPIQNDRPTKKPNVGSSTPSLCFLCNQVFHPVVDCGLMNANTARMKQRLDQLAANANPAAQPAIQALTRQYNMKLKQAARPPTKYINISD